MYTSPVLPEMTANQKAIEAELTKWGYESLWANGKGGGFWVKGLGYQSLEECAQIINRAIVQFFVDEKARLSELAERAMQEAKGCNNVAYFEKAVAVYLDSTQKLKELNVTPIPGFHLSNES